MNKLFKTWYLKYFSKTDSTILLLMIVGFISLLYLLNDILTPIFLSIIITYLLDGLVSTLTYYRIPLLVAVSTVLTTFISVILLITILLIPILSDQFMDLLQQFPNYILQGKKFAISVINKYPDFFSESLVDNIFNNIREQITGFGQLILTLIFAYIPNLVGLFIYIVMIPLLVFFMLIDKKYILQQVSSSFTHNQDILAIGVEINTKLGLFVRGKIIEIFFISAVSILSFAFLGLDYAVLLGFSVGLSVIVPFIGAILVTIPIVIIAILQWGWGSDFIWLVSVYSIILFLDANVLVPLLFAETLKMHPLSIMIAILIFGGLFGILGVFFAIPLAFTIKALLVMWPQQLQQV